MTVAIVAVFLLGYLFITMESSLKVNKSAVALFLSVACWVLYMIQCGDYVTAVHGADFAAWQATKGTDGITNAATYVADNILLHHLGDTSEIIFFLMCAMTIVEVVDGHGGFEFVRDRMNTRNKRSLLWRITVMTFILSAVLDNLTTSIVMIMVLRKLIDDRNTRLLYAGMVIIAANAGGAFSPIGDVTTIMLWVKGNITSVGVVKELLLPSIAAAVVPALIVQCSLKGKLESVAPKGKHRARPYVLNRRQRAAVFYVGVGGLVFVPIFRGLTDLPPFMGVVLVLAVLWIMTEYFFHKVGAKQATRVSDTLHKIDLSTILFFLGILMAVAVLQETGVLAHFGQFLEDVSGGNAYLVTGAIGVASAIIDNVPLVASCMGMYDIASSSAALAMPELQNFVVDGTFWQLLAFCAGTGGSILIIGSAAGVIVMGLEKITFGWYLRRFSLLALAGFFAGMVIYWLEKLLLF